MAAIKKKSQKLAEPIILADESDDDPTVRRLIYVTSGSASCDVCSELDGTVWNEDDANLPDLPLHPNCECELQDYDGKKAPAPRKAKYVAKKANKTKKQVIANSKRRKTIAAKSSGTAANKDKAVYGKTPVIPTGAVWAAETSKRPKTKSRKGS